MINTCRECGCTDNNACVTEDGPCYWINETRRDLCSSCVMSDDLFLVGGGAE